MEHTIDLRFTKGDGYGKCLTLMISFGLLIACIMSDKEK